MDDYGDVTRDEKLILIRLLLKCQVEFDKIGSHNRALSDEISRNSSIVFYRRYPNLR